MRRPGSRTASNPYFVTFENANRSGFIDLTRRFLEHGSNALPLQLTPEPTKRSRRFLPDAIVSSGYVANFSVLEAGSSTEPGFAVLQFEGPKGFSRGADAHATLRATGIDLGRGWSAMDDRHGVGFEFDAVGRHDPEQLCAFMCDGLLALGAPLATGSWTASMTSEADWALIEAIGGS